MVIKLKKLRLKPTKVEIKKERKKKERSALKQIINQGPYFTSNIHGDVICRYCEKNKTNGMKKHKAGCPWVVFQGIKL
jgi:hypothetical protein